MHIYIYIYICIYGVEGGKQTDGREGRKIQNLNAKGTDDWSIIMGKEGEEGKKQN
jgi:hypothetical protein